MYIPGIWASSKRSAAPAATSFVAWTGQTGANDVAVYPFSASGFGTKYTNPTLLTSVMYSSVTFNQAKNVIAFAIESSFSSGGKSIQAYPWSASGFGTAFADPATKPPGSTASPTVAQGFGIAFNYPDTVLALGTRFTGTGNRMAFYTWSNATGFGTLYSNPVTVMTGTSTPAIKFVPDNSRVFMQTALGTGINSYAWTDASGFGTKSGNPSSGSGNGQGTDYNNSFATPYVVSSRSGTPWISAWPFASTSFGTAWAAPATAPTSAGRVVKIHPNGDAIIMSGGTATGVIAYATGGSSFGTKFADPVGFPGSTYGVAFDRLGNNVAFSHEVSPYVSVYPWSSGGFGTKFANPASLPPGAAGIYGSAAFIS